MGAESQIGGRTRSPGAAADPIGVIGMPLRIIMALLIVVGAAAFFFAITSGVNERAWEAYLVNLLFWLGVAQGGIVVSAAFYLTQARWAGTVHYRLAEALVPFLIVGFVMFWGLYFGRVTIFPWVLHPVENKAAWLNTPFLFARDGAALFAMTALSLWFVRESRSARARAWAIDAENIRMPPAAVRRLAPAVAIVYAAVYSLVAFDLVMSLSPQWRSTLFGAYFFAGAFWSALAAMAFTAVLLRYRLGMRNTFRAPAVLHDFGKLVFAFSIFWVYLVFAQYIVIWYADIPVETFFVVQRVNYLPWAPLSWSALVLIWALPFVVLMGVRPKRTPPILGTIGFLGMVGIWLERYVLVVPSLSPHEVPFGVVELLITLGFLGLAVLCAIPGLNRVAVAATSSETAPRADVAA